MAPPPRPHLLARGKLAERANAFLGRAWDKGWLPPPVLEPDELWQVAAKPFGDRISAEHGGRCADRVADFRLRLEKLLEAVNGEADLNPLGQAMAYGQLTRVIRTRLALGQYWASNGTPRDNSHLAPPILIIGHMRSGTTRVHKLFSADPAHSHTRYCDAWRPVPGNLTMRRIKGALDLVMLGALNPWVQSIHPMKSGEVEEELAWLASALNHSIYESQWRIPSYSAFSEARDSMPVYAEFSQVLATDAAHRGTATKPRVMKAPQFSEDLACLLARFPTAHVVVTRRDKADVLKSAVSLVANQMAIQSKTCDLSAITAFCEHKIALREQRRDDALANWDGPITHLTFDALSQDWESEIARAYRVLGLTLSHQALSAMRAMMARESKGAHKAHASQLKSFAAPK